MRFRELYLESRLNSTFLLSGKLIRFTLFLVFIIALLSKTKEIAGFSLYQTLLFFMTFNLIDITSQFLLRGTYSIWALLNLGRLDLFLTQPINALFRIFSDLLDVLDLFTLIPVFIILALIMSRLDFQIGITSLLLYLVLCVNALIIATAIHVFILSISILTQEISSQIWVYRDLMAMARFPTDIYSKPLQLVMTFIVPIAVMVTFPAKALLGILTGSWILAGFVISAVVFYLSIKFWHFALRNYSSVST
jgi:ABC-2 type transport system permease protein